MLFVVFNNKVMQKLAIIALKYLEPEWQETQDCLSKVNYPVFYADRDGVGNMSRAFNEAFDKYVKGKFEYVWFVTNITFAPDVPDKLLEALETGWGCAIHPVMNTSDHLHLRSDGSNKAREVPFIEFTAPLIRCHVFDKFHLCEQTPYYYMDLIISHQINMDGGMVTVHNGAEVHHTYLRNKAKKHPISIIREQLRNYHTPLSKAYMVKTYGEDWQSKLWPK